MKSPVFVYGSLKSGLQHAQEMQGAEFLGRDTLQGAYLVLYEDDYPGLVLEPGSDDVVEGELYLVDRELLMRLDEFEECPELYQRSEAHLESGRTAWVYSVSKQKAESFQRIPGVWKGSET